MNCKRALFLRNMRQSAQNAAKRVTRNLSNWRFRGSITSMPDSSEQVRLESLYEKLRMKLLDLSRRNRMLNYSLGARSRRHIQIVDTTLEDVYARLVGEESKLKIAFLPEPEDLLPEEKTEDFLAALEH